MLFDFISNFGWYYSFQETRCMLCYEIWFIRDDTSWENENKQITKTIYGIKEQTKQKKKNKWGRSPSSLTVSQSPTCFQQCSIVIASLRRDLNFAPTVSGKIIWREQCPAKGTILNWNKNNEMEKKGEFYFYDARSRPGHETNVRERGNVPTKPARENDRQAFAGIESLRKPNSDSDEKIRWLLISPTKNCTDSLFILIV